MIPEILCNPLAAAMEALLAVLLVVGAGWDIACRRLPNWLNLAVALSFFPWAFAMGAGLHELLLAAVAAALCFGLGYLLFHLRQMGAGDVKLIVALALWFGLSFDLLRFLLYMGVAGGLMGILFLLLRLAVKRDLGELPYGVAITVAALVVKVSSTACFSW